ncbi:glycosyltransferase family 4 protein [Peptococcaceae bacterium]|nr:glycosyltransferase family 4 protein [Peptococcaceae bacterium]
MAEKNNYQILIVGTYPPPYGGISVHIERLRNILVNSGIYECRILDVVSGVDAEKKKAYKKITVVNGNKITKLIKSLVEIKNFKGDIIHYHVTALGNFKYVGIMFNHINKKVKKMLTVHSGSFIKDYINSNWVDKKLIVWNLKMFDCIITVNNAQADFIKNKLNVKKQIITIPAFLPPEYSDCKDDNPIIKEEMQKLKRKFKKIIVSSGSMREYYGFHIIIEAIKELSKECSENIALIIATYAEPNLKYSNEILNSIKGLGNVKLYNDLKPVDFALILKQSDIFIRATDRDGDAVSIREAMYFNKQILASDCVDRPEGVVLFKTMDKSDLKTKMKKVLCNTNFGKAVNEIESDKRLLDLYRSILKKGGKK